MDGELAGRGGSRAALAGPVHTAVSETASDHIWPAAVLQE